LRSYLPEPTAVAYSELKAKAAAEVERISGNWRHGRKPDYLFCYHTYYKAPDLVGAVLARVFRIPYATIEASYSNRRNIGIWADTQICVVEAVKLANANFCFTMRDRLGLAAIAPEAKLEMLHPFIDTTPFTTLPDNENVHRLVAIAMMRKGDKFDSYKILAKALALVTDLPWTLTVIGDGEMRSETTALFDSIPAGRIEWLGEVSPDQVPTLLRSGGIFVWPGCGEAYGLAYLEAQAAGLAVVAQNTAGVPEVVRDSVTGILTPPGDINAYANAIRRLLTNGSERRQMAMAARRFVLDERSLSQTAQQLAGVLADTAMWSA
jgi:glycosyltransferase involved in cell wall biosynthesis